MFKNEEGFSLLELVVAVGVAGIIAAVALPTFAGLQDKATTTSATYAASASAAEALANSTIGGLNGITSNASNGGSVSSNTGGSESSNTGASLTGNLINSLNYPHGLWLTNVSSSGGGTGPANGEFKIQTGQELAQFSAISAAAANNGLAGKTITFSNINGMFNNGSNASVEGRSFTIVSSSYNYVNLNGMDWGYVTSVKWTYNGAQFETMMVTGTWTIN